MKSFPHRIAACLRLCILALPCLALLPGAAHAEPLLKDGHRVLFIGNSYTFFHGGLPRHLKDACAAAEEPLAIETAMVTAGGKELDYLFTSTDAVQIIREGNWDLVILQGGYNAPVIAQQHENFKDSVRKFHQVIVESGAKPVIWAVWEQRGHNPQGDIWKRIDTVTREIAEELEIPVVPVGTLWAGIRRHGLEGTGIDGETFLYQDSVHPSRQAVHMNTLIFYTFLTGRSPVGFNFRDRNREIANPGLAAAIQAHLWKSLREE